jgi:hypothetical protein
MYGNGNVLHCRRRLLSIAARAARRRPGGGRCLGLVWFDRWTAIERFARGDPGKTYQELASAEKRTD